MARDGGPAERYCRDAIARDGVRTWAETHFDNRASCVEWYRDADPEPYYER